MTESVWRYPERWSVWRFRLVYPDQWFRPLAVAGRDHESWPIPRSYRS